MSSRHSPALLLFLLYISSIASGYSEVQEARWKAWLQANVGSILGLGEDEFSSRDFEDGDDRNIKNHWALLVAGSSGWGNYRHQADVSHAYHVLTRGGLDPRRIVVMMADDIAHNPENPFQGAIFNRPGGPNVYEGVHIDYRGPHVNAANFLSVLLGDARAMEGLGSGRVIRSGPDDRVFVFFSDHGAPGVLGMPTGDFLYADDLLATLRKKRRQRGYREMVVYIEACESGSIFEGLLSSDLRIYATTAANAQESSWGTYCPGMDPGPPDEISTCLGDLYSVTWMENSDVANLTVETLHAQYDLMRERTSNNYTYAMGSHVMQYGCMRIEEELAGSYLGMKNTGEDPSPPPPPPSSSQQQQQQRSATASRRLIEGRQPWKATLASAAAGSGSSVGSSVGSSSRHRHHRVEQRDADLVHLRHKHARASTAEEKLAAKAALDQALGQRQRIDQAARQAASHLLLSPATSATLMANLGWTAGMVLEAAGSGYANSLHPKPHIVEDLVRGSMGRPAPDKPLVDDWDCLKGMVHSWTGVCGAMDTYSMRHTRFFANLCNAGVRPEDLARALQGSECRQQVVVQ